MLAWQPTTTDDHRRLRYVFERATVAALATGATADARALVARARELPASGYSDYQVVHRDRATPMALSDPEAKRLVEALESGDLAEERVRAEAARAEMPLANFLAARQRDPGRDAGWHLAGLVDIMAAVGNCGLSDLVPDLRVSVGPPASDAEIAAYQAMVPEPLPGQLVELWRDVGGGGFTCERLAIRLLSPAELVAKRADRRAALRGWLGTRLRGRKRDAMFGRLADLDVVATIDDEPLIVLDTRRRDGDGRFWSSDSATWQSELAQMIASDIAAELVHELERRIGDVFRLKLGQRAGAGVRRIRLANGDKQWEAIVDGDQLMTRTLTAASNGKPSIKKLANAETATRAFDAAVASARARGYRATRR
jgi:hypothetical protein